MPHDTALASTADLHPAVATAATVEGWMGVDELGLLAFLAAAVPADRAVVEVGNYRGRSTVALALGSRSGAGAPVYSIDPHTSFVGPRGGTFGPPDQRALYENLTRTGVGEEVFVVALGSPAVARSWAGPRVGLLFVDGDHRAEAVWEDVWSWWPHLADDAVVAFDDVDYDGVARVVDALVALGQLTAEGRTGKVGWFRTGGERRA